MPSAPHTSLYGTREALWIEFRDPHTRKLLCRYDPIRQLLEIADRGHVNLIDLCAEREKFLSAMHPQERPERP